GIMYTKSRRFYRYQHQIKPGWITFQVRYRETDLWIRAYRNLEKETLSAVLSCRRQLEQYISQHPEFVNSLQPLPDDPLAPPLARHMIEASRRASVGPMAGVAGAIAQAVAQNLKPYTASIIIENGGDCYLDLAEETSVGIYAGPHSPFSGKLALRFAPERFPFGICTSSGTIGHSLSFGKADAVVVVSKDAAVADAAATALGNMINGPSDIGEALKWAPEISSVEGVLIVVKDKMGVWGDLELMPL
ncbi:MAG: UPF0280 family protein, partial [Syntrophobacteraceae bacterium]